MVLGWVGHDCQTLADDQGEFPGYPARNPNIPERKKAEAALAESSIRRK